MTRGFSHAKQADLSDTGLRNVYLAHAAKNLPYDFRGTFCSSAPHRMAPDTNVGHSADWRVSLVRTARFSLRNFIRFFRSVNVVFLSVAISCFIQLSCFVAEIWELTLIFSSRIPVRYYLLIGFLAMATIGLSNVSLAYLNYPTQVVFKCCKLIPVLIGGVLIQGTNTGA